MTILITGSAGFVGKNLTAALSNIRDGKDRTHQSLCPTLANIHAGNTSNGEDASHKNSK